MNAERTGALFWLLFGCAAIYGGLDLELGTMQEPGSGFLTFVAGTFVSCMALIIIVQSYREDQTTSNRVTGLWKGKKWKRAVAITLLNYSMIVRKLRVRDKVFTLLLWDRYLTPWSMAHSVSRSLDISISHLSSLEADIHHSGTS